MTHVSEYEVETRFIDRLESIGYEYVDLANYHEVLANFRQQLAAFNAEKLIEKKGEATLTASEFDRVLIHLNNHSVYESAKLLRDKYVLMLDNGEIVYLEFFSGNANRNIYQVAHQITMEKDHLDDVAYKNRYDVTVLVNGLPLVQVELKRPGVEINEAINQINRYRKFSFRDLFHFLQLFVVSNSVNTKYFCNENEFSEDGTYNPILKSLAFFWTDANNVRITNLEAFASEFFRKTALTEMLDKYMVIKTTEPVLMVMRPYQIFAVRAARKRVLETNRNGYVFACTGSGKTLTSFKLAQLLRDEPAVEKVIFLIDRKDLDDQTVDEYNAFERDCVDTTDNTHVLVRQLEDMEHGLIVTTIQKMANAVRNPRYEHVMDAYREKKVVFIVDECHRSQFGRMHALIAKHFKNANYIGFTGTPIFEENRGSQKLTTADVFSAGPRIEPCLHRYMIKDAIADGNVLPFSVEYQRSLNVTWTQREDLDQAHIDDPEYCTRHNIDISSLYHEPERIQNVTRHILEHHYQHTHLQNNDVYTALFAVDSIKTLAAYYREFKVQDDFLDEDEHPKVAAIFTYQANEDMDEGADEHSRELLEDCIADYNAMFGTSFCTNTFDAYRKDIAKRMKQRDLPQVDILLVVNMFLTGFDAKPCNTLYLDKNLVWHSLVQAYSRTNRVFKLTKQFGQIVTYRNIKKWQDEALTLFSGDGNPNEYLLENYEYYVQQWISEEPRLRHVAPTVDCAGQLKSEDDIREFILAFRALARTLAVLKTFSEFEWADLEESLGEEEYEGYKSWYLYFRDLLANPNPPIPIPVDVDFDIELVRTDRINVAYILSLLKKVQATGKTEEERQADLDLILREIERSDNEALRLKRGLMRDFVLNRFYELPDDTDMMAAYAQFEKEQLQLEIEKFAVDHGLTSELISHIFSDYEFNGHVAMNDVREQLAPYKLGLRAMTRLAGEIQTFIKETYRKYQAEAQ